MILFRRHYYSNKAYSLVEVVVAAVIFAGSSMLAFGSIAKLKQTESSSVGRLNASLMAKKILDGLSKDVNAQAWAAGNLSIGTHSGLTDTDFSGCSASYVVTNSVGARKVVITVTW